jgi:prephenate dehydrogenase
MKKLKVAVVGYGQFGRFMTKHLRPHCTVVPIQRKTKPEIIRTCDVVIFAVPWNGLETAIEALKPYISSKAAIVDVTSVKQKPLALLTKHFKGHEILGTHPIFGPQSGKNGLVNLPIVLSNVSFSKKHYAVVKRFLKQTLKLRVIEQTAKEHDSDMARVQGLTHFIGRAIVQMDIKSHLTNTKSYEQLLELKDLLADDGWELFQTIQNTNPEASKVRDQFIKKLTAIEESLSK